MTLYIPWKVCIVIQRFSISDYRVIHVVKVLTHLKSSRVFFLSVNVKT